MKVRSERDIDIKDLLNQIQFNIKRAGKAYKTEVNKQLLVDCHDVIKEATSGEDDCK